MYAPTAWPPLPTGHGPLGLASQKKGQVTRRDSDDTQRTKCFYIKKPLFSGSSLFGNHGILLYKETIKEWVG